MASRWRAWDMEWLDSQFSDPAVANSEPELISAVGKERGFKNLSISSIVLPRAALKSNDSVSNSDSKLSTHCGRGKSLKNRALSQDKPGRRPGEKDKTTQSGAISLGSQFLGSRYLFEESFPGLNETNTPKSAEHGNSKSLQSSGTTSQPKQPSINFAMIVSESKLPKPSNLPLFGPIKDQTRLFKKFSQKPCHSDNSVKSSRSTSKNSTKQPLSFSSAKDTTPSMVIPPKKLFPQINISRKPVAVKSMSKSTSLSSNLTTQSISADCLVDETTQPILSPAITSDGSNTSNNETPLVGMSETTVSEAVFNESNLPKSDDVFNGSIITPGQGQVSTIPQSFPPVDQGIEVEIWTMEERDTSVVFSDNDDIVVDPNTSKVHVADDDNQETNKLLSQSHQSEKVLQTDDYSTLSQDGSVIDAFTELSGKDKAVKCSTQNIDKPRNQPSSTFDNGASAEFLNLLYQESIQTPGRIILEEYGSETSIVDQQSNQPLIIIDQSIQEQENNVINGEIQSAKDHEIDTINTPGMSADNLLLSDTSDVNAHFQSSNQPLNTDDQLMQSENDQEIDTTNTPGISANLLSSNTGSSDVNAYFEPSNQPLNTDEQSTPQQENSGINSEMQSENDQEIDTMSTPGISANLLSSNTGSSDVNAYFEPSNQPLNTDEQSTPQQENSGINSEMQSENDQEIDTMSTPGISANLLSSDTGCYDVNAHFEPSNQPLNTDEKSPQQQENSGINSEMQSENDQEIDTTNTPGISTDNLLSSDTGSSDVNAHFQPSNQPLNTDEQSTQQQENSGINSEMQSDNDQEIDTVSTPGISANLLSSDTGSSDVNAHFQPSNQPLNTDEQSTQQQDNSGINSEMQSDNDQEIDTVSTPGISANLLSSDTGSCDVNAHFQPSNQPLNTDEQSTPQQENSGINSEMQSENDQEIDTTNTPGISTDSLLSSDTGSCDVNAHFQPSHRPLNTDEKSPQQQENSGINGEIQSAKDHDEITSNLDTINIPGTSHDNLTANNGTRYINANKKSPIVTKLNLQNTDSCDDNEKEHLQENDSQEKLGDEMPGEPCDVKLENLPLSLTEEDLVEIIEPYGSMISCVFLEEVDNSKTTIIRLADTVSGEWLAVSLDGLEIDGHRMRTTVVEV